MQKLGVSALSVPTLNHPQPHPETTTSSPIHLTVILLYFSGAVLQTHLSSHTKIYKALCNQAKENSGKEALSFQHRSELQKQHQIGSEVVVATPTAANLRHNEMQTFQFQNESFRGQSNVVHVGCAQYRHLRFAFYGNRVYNG